MAPYWRFYNSTCQFRVLSTPSRGLLPVSQKNTLVDAGGPLNVEEDVDTTSKKCSANTDDSLHHLTYFMFVRLHALVLNCKLYPEDRKWSGL